MMREFWRLRVGLSAAAGRPYDIADDDTLEPQLRAIRGNIFGADLLPQAAEIAKLSLWLSSVRKDHPVDDLSQQVVPGNSLDISTIFDRLRTAPGTFDLVVGNPPWGGHVERHIRERCVQVLEIDASEPWDTWELFLLLAIKALRDGGRLSILIPDAFFLPNKSRIRKMLFEQTTVERVYALGPDWFTNQVRVGTIALQARVGAPKRGSMLRGMVLSGDLRRQAIAGQVPLTQVEAMLSRQVPQQRTIESPSYDVEVLRGSRDDAIMSRMEASSLPLFSMCDHARGDEMNKAGLAWRCSSCGQLTTPGAKLKGGGYRDKKCPSCDLLLTETTVQEARAVTVGYPNDGATASFIDGDDLGTRYGTVKPTKQIALDMIIGPKSDETYTPPKILVREAGVGLTATLDYTPSRCPRSVYVYRLRPDFLKEGYRHEFILAAILSRTMNYFVIKRYGETDPAKAFAKLRIEHIDALPIPRVDFADATQRRAHRDITDNVRLLLSGEAKNGGREDLEIEMQLRRLWGIGPEDGAYINGEFYNLPRGQVVASLFPAGPPLPIVQ